MYFWLTVTWWSPHILHLLSMFPPRGPEFMEKALEEKANAGQSSSPEGFLWEPLVFEDKKMCPSPSSTLLLQAVPWPEARRRQGGSSWLSEESQRPRAYGTSTGRDCEARSQGEPRGSLWEALRTTAGSGGAQTP